MSPYGFFPILVRISDGYASPLADLPESLSKSSEYLLVETIRRVGVSNYSLIARLTGLNPETVRYKVNKQLRKMGLKVQVNVDLARLGFNLNVLQVKARMPTEGKSWIDHASYLTFVSKIMGSDRYVCLYALPYRFKKKYLDELSGLQRTHLIEQYESLEVSWIRYPPLRTEFYDFDNRSWTIDWNKIDMMRTEIGSSSLFPAYQDAKVDSIDITILKSLQDEPTVNPAKIAKRIDANARTVRYHYLEHIVKGKLVLNNNVRWVNPSLDEGKKGEQMQVVFSFRNLNQDEMESVRKLCNKIPFTWLEVGTTARSYFAFMDIPVAYFQETISHIEINIYPVRERFEMMMLDPGKTRTFGIPQQMFDVERGWRLLPFQEELNQPEMVEVLARSPSTEEEL